MTPWKKKIYILVLCENCVECKKLHSVPIYLCYSHDVYRHEDRAGCRHSNPASCLKLDNETSSEACNKGKQFLLYFILFLIILGHLPWMFLNIFFMYCYKKTCQWIVPALYLEYSSLLCFLYIDRLLQLAPKFIASPLQKVSCSRCVKCTADILYFYISFHQSLSLLQISVR